MPRANFRKPHLIFLACLFALALTPWAGGMSTGLSQPEASMADETVPEYDGPLMMAVPWPADAEFQPRASQDVTSSSFQSGYVDGYAFGRCPEIGSVWCDLISHNTLLATDDAGGVYISVSDAEEGDGWTWSYHWPVNDPDDGTTEPIGDCPTQILPPSHPDNPTGNTALIVYCSYPGGPPTPHPAIEFPSGCPCSFIFGVLPVISGEGVGLEPWGAWHPGVWPVQVYYDEPGGSTMVVDDEFILRAVPAVLLVHGYGSSCGAFGDLGPWLVNRLVDPTDFPYTADYDAQDRVKCFDPPGGHPSGGYDHTLGTILLGRQLQRYVEGSGGFLEQVEPVPSGKIDIVAHSFGGLVSRWYIEEVKGGAAPVSSLTMLGTPNRGTPLADWAVRLDMLDFVREDQAAWDMRLDSNDPGSVVDHLLYYVNNGFVMPAATTYRVEVGTWSAPAWDLILGRPNDCVVSASSARGPFPGVAQERLVSHRGTCTAAAGGLLDDASSNCSTDPGHVFCDVNDMLEIPITAGVTATLQALTLLAQIAPQATSSPWEPSPQSGMASGQVGPGEVNEHLAQIDASAATADFALFWAYESSPSALRLTLETPTGSIIDSSAPGVTHSPAAEIADGYMVEEYHVDTPEVGQWVMRVEGVSVPPEGQAYAVVAVMDSPVTLSASVTPDSISPGETLTLAAELSQPAGPILGATITVSITKPDGSGGAVTLLDDGSGGDSQANDGIYSGAFGDTSACGAYSLAFHVEGTAASGSFERDESTAILAHVTEDAVGDPCNRDDDDDHMPDDYELANLCLDPVVGDGSEDPDADGLANFGEMTLGTDPCSYDPWLADDGDGDGFTDGVEQCLGTDPLDACPDNPSDDAWPLDIDMNGDLSVTGDVFYYRGRIGATPSDPEWWQRLDLDMNGDISVTGDVFMYRGRIGETCT